MVNQRIKEMIKAVSSAEAEGHFDNESAHMLYDNLIVRRLEELDPEFMKALDVQFQNVEFWYA